MLSLQEICRRTVCLNPEKTLGLELDELNQPCLQDVVLRLSIFDLLKYEKALKLRSIDTEDAICQCLRKIAVQMEDTHMATVVCPHLLDICPADGQNWTLCRMLSQRVVRCIVEEMWSVMKTSAFSLSDWQSHLIETQEGLLQLFFPPSLDHKYVAQRKRALQPNAVEKLTLLSFEKICSITIDLKFCQVFWQGQFKHFLQVFFTSLQVLSMSLTGSKLFVKTLKFFRCHAKNPYKVCLYVIRKNDVRHLDELLSVVSGVAGFHTTKEGEKNKISLDAVLGDMQELVSIESNSEGENVLDSSLDLDDLPEVKTVYSDEFHEEDEEYSESCFVTSQNTSYNNSTANRDLMDDALLLGPSYPQSPLDSNEGMARVDLKVTNLVNNDLYSGMFQHHLCHWLALRELHLGVPVLGRVLVQGLLHILRRPQFKCLTLSSAAVFLKEMEDILVTVATSRLSHPLEKLMFVCLHTRFERQQEPLFDMDLSSSDEEFESAVSDITYERLCHLGSFMGTKLLEVFWCGFCVHTDMLFRTYIQQDVAIRSLCINNSVAAAVTKLTLHSLSKNCPSIGLHTLILIDWKINSLSRCQVLVGLLKNFETTLTSLSLRGCLVDRGDYQFTEIISTISRCKYLKSLDLSENMLAEDTVSLIKTVVRNDSLLELSLRANRLPVETMLQSLKTLQHITLFRNTRLKVLDIRRNKSPAADNDCRSHLEASIKTLHQCFVDQILYDF